MKRLMVLGGMLGVSAGSVVGLATAAHAVNQERALGWFPNLGQCAAARANAMRYGNAGGATDIECRDEGHGAFELIAYYD